MKIMDLSHQSCQKFFFSATYIIRLRADQSALFVGSRKSLPGKKVLEAGSS